MRMWRLYLGIADILYTIGFVLGVVVFAGLIWFFLPAWIAAVFALLITTGVVLGIQQIRQERRSVDTEANG